MSPFVGPDKAKWLSRTEAGKALGLPWERIKPLIDKGELTGLQRGHQWYVDRASVAAFIKRRGF